MKAATMNKTLLYIVMFVFLSFSVTAITADYHIECRTDDCIEGNAAIVNVSVFNDRNYPIYIFDVEITHAQEQIGLARTGGRVILPGLAERVTFYTELPTPVDGKITTIVCVSVKAQNTETICTDAVSTNVLLAADVQCTKDRDCASNENCIDYQCNKFRCDYCQYIQNHECRRYQCCADTDCPSEMACTAHACRIPPKTVTTDVTTKNKTLVIAERTVAPRMQPAPAARPGEKIIEPEKPITCAEDEKLSKGICKKTFFSKIKSFFRNLFKRK